MNHLEFVRELKPGWIGAPKWQTRRGEAPGQSVHHLWRLNHPNHPGPADMVSCPARRIPRCRHPKAWDALADIEVFISAAEAELAAMDRERTGVHRRGRKPDPDRRRRVLGLIWMLTYGGMQWRIAGVLCGIPFTTLHGAFGSGSAWPLIGAWPAGTTPCPLPSWPTAARSAPPRAAGCAALMAAS